MALLTVELRPPVPPVVVTVAGEVDLSTAGTLRAALRGAPAGDLVVDLGGVWFFSAAGLRVLLEEREQRCARGSALVVVAAPACVRRILRLAGSQVPSLPTIADAVGTGPRPAPAAAAPR